SVTAPTRSPGSARTFGCPNCGATFTSSDGHACSFRDQVVDTGRFDWRVTGSWTPGASERPPSSAGTLAERGTDAPARRHPRLDAELTELRRDDPPLSDAARGERVGHLFREIDAGWTARDLGVLRPWV